MKKIMIVDDSGTARLFIRRCLEIVLTEEVIIIEAVNGKDALTTMKQESPDLVLTDLNMPVMDGLTFVKRVAASPKLHGTPVVFITSVNNPARREELVAQGASAVLGKPVTPKALSETLEEIFAKTE
ncbi:MAG: response regulator [Planctomycetes bacterium]|nr:response regulator [Planctomycetota bacterium]